MSSSASLDDARLSAVITRAFVPAILAGLVLVLMLPVLCPPTGNEVLNGHDLLNQQYPLYSFIFDSVRNGNGLPLWNPYQFGGQSIPGNPQSTIFYPPAWMMVLTDVPHGVGWLVILHLWLGAWGMAAFVGQLGASRVGALVGGIVYTFSGLMAAHLNAGHLNYLMCAAWLPWMAATYLWTVGRANGFNRALVGGAAVGMGILTGHPPMLYFGLVWLAVMFLFIVFGTKQATFFEALRPLVVMFVVGGLLGAALLLPVAEFTTRSTRVEGGLYFSNSYALSPEQLVTLLIPNLFGEPNRGYWGAPFYEELTAYMGILPLVAVFLVRRRAATVLLTGFVVVGVVVSLGINGGLFAVLYYLLPGYSLFRVPSRALYFVVVGGAGLAALLVTDLQTVDRAEWVNRLRWTRILPVIAAICLIAAVVVGLNQPEVVNDADILNRQVSQAVSMLILAGMVIFFTWVALHLWTGLPFRWALLITLLFLWVDVGRVSAPLVTVAAVDVPEMWKAMSRVAPASPDFRVMTLPNQIVWQAGATYTKHLNASGYDPLVSDAYQRLLDASAYNPTSPIARLLGVRYLISDQPYEYSGLPGLESLISKVEDNGWFIYEIADPLPRVFVTSDIRVMDDETARNGLTSGEIDPLTTAVVETSVDCETGSGESSAQIASYSPNVVDISAQTESGGLLVLTDSYDPNWTVMVDNAPAELVRVDTALRGVCLPAGEHAVQFTFQPRAFYVGLVISMVAWIILAIFGLVIWMRQWREQ